MSSQIELQEGDQRVFLVDVTSRESERVTGRLYCGFCRGYSDVCWYPNKPEQYLEEKVVLQHFRNCPDRGGVTTFPLAVFDGDGAAKLITRISIR
jgi:hypothetical protein